MYVREFYVCVCVCEEYKSEYDKALAQEKDNHDIKAIRNLFESRLPLVLDFIEHVHYSNTQVLDYVLTRMILLLDTEGRTGYRRVLMQFLNDLEKLSGDLRELLLRNMNSLCAVDIELLHGLYSSIIPAVHRCKTEQEAINNACRDVAVLKVVKEHNTHYHDEYYQKKKQVPCGCVCECACVSVHLSVHV